MFDFLIMFGTPSERALKKINPYLKKIYQAHEPLKTLSDEQLREQTIQLKTALKDALHPFQEAIQNFRREAEEKEDIRKKITLYKEIDTLQKKCDQEEKKILLKLLPQAFAILKETAHRFATKEYLSLPATTYDKSMATQYKHVTIKKGEACWANKWEAGGQMVKWDMVPYDVQLLGGIVLHQGKVAEMRTGEGKTLAATLPIFLNALTEKGVHVITVNDYLARRDAAWMAPLFQFHQLTVDCVDQHPPFSEKRKKAYQADITYATGSATGFDYLRDNMATSPDEKVQRGHYYAIVDEVDSVLIDEARTPLIISGPVTYTSHQEYQILKPIVQQLYLQQKTLITEYLQEAKSKLQQEDKKIKEEGGVALFRVYRGLPKYKPFIQFLSQEGIKQTLSKTEDYFIQENARMMPEADEPLLFTIDDKLNHINLTDKGIEYLSKKNNEDDFFILPDISIEIALIEKSTTLKEQEKITKKEKFIKDYTIKSARLHAINQLLRAYATFEKEVDYVVINGEVKIIDEKTGRLQVGKRYSNGIHQAIEAKENVRIQEATQTYATITPQNQFRMYEKLAGMTGTAETESAEFWEIYKLPVIIVPTHKPVIRKDHDDLVFKTKKEKLVAIKKLVEELKQQQRPILVNTTSVESSEEMRKLLGIKANEVLNARNHAIESKIIAQAGEPSKVTIVTQMGGRGTDIKLSPESKKAGGLFVLLSEKNPNQRIDNQARGRSGRQGDPGASQAFVSLEDSLIAHFRHGFIGKQMDKAFHEEGETIQDPMITRALTTAQERIEEQNFVSRKRSLEYDDVMNMQRAVIYGKRNHALSGKRLSLDIMSMFYNTIATLIDNAKNRQSLQSLQLDLKKTFNRPFDLTNEQFLNQSTNQLTQTLYKEVCKHYQKRQKELSEKLIAVASKIPSKKQIEYFELPTLYGKTQINILVNLPQTLATKGEEAIRAIESTITLHFLDEYWKRHLLQMDQLREATRNVVYQQKDPLLVYKFKSLELFKQLIQNINQATLSYLMHWTFPFTDIQKEAKQQQRGAYIKGLQLIKNNDLEELASTPSRTPMSTQRIANRNQRVTVQYKNGDMKKDVKYKTIEDDLLNGHCELIKKIELKLS